MQLETTIVLDDEEGKMKWKAKSWSNESEDGH